MAHLRIATRSSALALWQAEWVKAELEKTHPGLTVELLTFKTQGDIILDVPLAKVGGKGLFVKELEVAMREGKADIAVHSMKDVPTEFPEGLFLAAVCDREDPRDAFIGRTAGTLGELREGAVVGTSSLRRQTQLLAARPDLSVVSLRGNVQTRLRKLEEENMDAIILAAAGVKRMELSDRVTSWIDPAVMLPAVGQGALGIEARVDDVQTLSLIEFLNHEPTRVCVEAERAFLARLEGGCQVPIAAHATVEGQKLTLEGLVGAVDGSVILRDSRSGSVCDREALGVALAEELLGRGGDKILAEAYGRE